MSMSLERIAATFSQFSEEWEALLHYIDHQRDEHQDIITGLMSNFSAVDAKDKMVCHNGAQMAYRTLHQDLVSAEQRANSMV